MAHLYSLLSDWFRHYMMSADALVRLEQALGYEFTDKELAVRALTHRSLCQVNLSYERLEFLGDRVLALILSETLYHKFPNADQGELTKRYHPLAKESALAHIAQKGGLQSFILADDPSDISARPSVQSDIVESLIAALYLDGGMEIARKFINDFWVFDEATPDDRSDNPKSALQEWAAARQLGFPDYKVAEKQGPEHAPHFIVTVMLGDTHKAQGEGSSRKAGEQDAARRLLSRLANESDVL